ncbi:tripartite motif-containing protein 3-like isoform X2 [Dreissena polymorpha]|uniref:RING-type domain-containing protein n=2 Tax=Dreissena polymorpha TaxID=45954 RepID=A0A9D3Z0F2_DREPO|nr:tripartite motif-containing protein 3-like isoform X2 [Dreissena polymorpha]XP_052250421.1 tripartite motif-containing protein 3-like isoform X2 [Dreissena polymorpha]KAH3710443.1 hypothetical protein DPMN_069925 [Dreissena polymorpha]
MTALNNSMTIKARIREDFLTCPICFNSFTNPKALPCLHTFCLQCLVDYVKDNTQFPCPTCREVIVVPPQGMSAFKDDYRVISLQDTVGNNSLSPAQENHGPTNETAPDNRPVPAPRSRSPRPIPAPRNRSPVPATQFLPDLSAPEAETQKSDLNGENSSQNSASPSYENQSNYSNNDNSMQHFPQSENPAGPKMNYLTVSNLVSDGISGVAGAVGNTLTSISNYLGGQSSLHANILAPTSPYEFVPKPLDSLSNPYQNPPAEPINIYPQININPTGACSKGLLLEFGKYGPEIDNFLKPFGLAVNSKDEFIVTDRGGNRVFVFNSHGILACRFTTDCGVNGVAATRDGNILIAVNNDGSAIMRLYSIHGKLMQSVGKHFKFDHASGITVTQSDHVAISNIAADNVLVFTKNRSFSLKFGSKGGGNLHFKQPTHVTSTNKDYILVSDTGNHCLKLFDVQGNFKRSIGSHGNSCHQLDTPLGIACDANDNIIVADSNNFSVKIFSIKGDYVTTLVKDTHEIGPGVKPINVAVTSNNNVAVLLFGTGYGEVRIYKWRGGNQVGF